MKPWLPLSPEPLGWKREVAWITLTLIAIAAAETFGFRPVAIVVAGVVAVVLAWRVMVRARG